MQNDQRQTYTPLQQLVNLETKPMPVSATNSKLIYDALKECDIRLVSALPETWLVHLIRSAEE
ncbi:MAG: hypothetical protein WBQ01_17255, partial [Candidatus Sulfotelmatobacter sp.]